MSKDILEIIEDRMQSMKRAEKFSRGLLINSLGFIEWEEPLEDYEYRMLQLGDEYPKYLSEKRQTIIDKTAAEVHKLSELINDFENKMKEKE